MNPLIILYVGLVASLIIGAGFLHLLPRLGKVGQEISDWFCYAPGIDLALAYFMLISLSINQPNYLRSFTFTVVACLDDQTKNAADRHTFALVVAQHHP